MIRIDEYVKSGCGLHRVNLEILMILLVNLQLRKIIALFNWPIKFNKYALSMKQYLVRRAIVNFKSTTQVVVVEFIVCNMLFQFLWWIFWYFVGHKSLLVSVRGEVLACAKSPNVIQIVNVICNILKLPENMQYLFSLMQQHFGHTLKMHCKCSWRCFMWTSLTNLGFWSEKSELD